MPISTELSKVKLMRRIRPMGEERLTSRAQARGVDDALRDSGTGTAIPRCLQRIVRPNHSRYQFGSDIAQINDRTIKYAPQTAKPTNASAQNIEGRRFIRQRQAKNRAVKADANQ